MATRTPASPTTEPLNLDDVRFTLGLSCRHGGSLRHFIARMQLDNPGDGDLMLDPDGSLPTWSTAEAARAEAARRFDAVDATTEAEPELAGLRRTFEESFGGAVTVYDLDAAAAWAATPAQPITDPEALLEIWMLLAWTSDAPPPHPFDGMWLAGQHMGSTPGPHESLIATSMKLSGVVRELTRRPETPLATLMAEPLWERADSNRLSSVLSSGIAAFAARLRSV